ncbi:MAG: hypothetical protein HQ538_04865 [Parcubacteria group bacterium]|nr:hypothetical protein [Parcubacteria group bacterium]
MSKIVSINNAYEFLEECLRLNKKFVTIIKRRSKFLPDQGHSLIYNFFIDNLRFCSERTNFVLDNMKNTKKDSDLEIIRTLIRGVFDLYLKTLYIISVDKKEALKKIIGEKIHVAAILKMHKEDSIKILYGVMKKEGINMMGFSKVVTLVYEFLLNKFSSRKNRNLYNNEFKCEFRFPGARRIINNYVKKDSLLSREKIGVFYSLLSEQVHANTIYEIHKKKINLKYQLFGMLCVFNLMMLKIISDEFKYEKNKVKEMIKFYDSDICSITNDLWQFDKK